MRRETASEQKERAHGFVCVFVRESERDRDRDIDRQRDIDREKWNETPNIRHKVRQVQRKQT